MSSEAEGRTFTLAQLAELCGVPPAVIRAWVERDLLVPLRRGRAPVFAFAQAAAARTLALLRGAGWTPARIARSLQRARTVVRDRDAALAGLTASLDAQRLCVRTPDGRLLEPGGQLLFDFGNEGGTGGGTVHDLRSPRDWFQIGVEAEAQGRYEEAVRAYAAATADGDGDAETRFNLGNCLWRIGQRSEACAQYEQAVAMAPDYAEAWNNLGIARQGIGDMAGARVAFLRALQLVPYYADAHFNLADLLAAHGDRDGARRHWRAYLSYDPNSRCADQVRRRLADGGDDLA
jgi:tetratricopeptide (TPR) repeat protein